MEKDLERVLKPYTRWTDRDEEATKSHPDDESPNETFPKDIANGSTGKRMNFPMKL